VSPSLHDPNNSHVDWSRFASMRSAGHSPNVGLGRLNGRFGSGQRLLSEGIPWDVLFSSSVIPTRSVKGIVSTLTIIVSYKVGLSLVTVFRIFFKIVNSDWTIVTIMLAAFVCQLSSCCSHKWMAVPRVGMGVTIGDQKQVDLGTGLSEGKMSS